MKRRRFFAAVLASVPVLLASAASAPTSDFQFAGPAAPGAIAVGADQAYTPARGYGFDLGTTYSRDRPFFFSVAVPEGNYRVAVTLGDATAPTRTTVKAESRRLMLDQVATAPGRFVTRIFTVNVRTPYLPPSGDYPAGSVRLDPRERGILDWDHKLTLEFDGPHPGLAALRIAPANDVITVFIAGDSTVTDQPREPWSSWGQMLPCFFQPGVAVADNAESGETLKAFIFQGRLEKILSRIKAGDYLFIQFGHNDMKRNWPATYADAFTTYEAYLKVFVAEARLRHAIPVLVTPMNRRTFDREGRVTNSLGNYPEAVRRAARDEHVALIDLNAMSKRLYEALGPAGTRKAFVDNTHQDDYGGYELAKCICEGIREDGLGLARCLTGDFQGFDPDHPDPFASVDIPPSPGWSDRQPLGN